jgi:hypothetical protein
MVDVYQLMLVALHRERMMMEDIVRSKMPINSK